MSVSGSPVTGSGTIGLSYAAGYQGYTTAEATKLAGVATGATANTGTVTSVGLSVPTGLSVSGTPVTAAGTISIGYAAGYQGYSSAEATKLSGIATGATANVGTVTSVALSGGATGLSASGGPITGSGTLTLAGTLALANGGTGATTAAAARTALGLGTIATQTASAVTIIGGSITNISALQASSASGAMTVLIDAPAGQSAGHYLRSGTSARWLLRKGGGTEAGGNVGSDLLIERFDDSGAAIASAISVERATGTVTLGGITRPSTDNNRSCGTAALRWSELFAGNGTVNTSDARLKTDVEPFDDALLDAWSAIGWVRYRWRDALAEKGPEAARWHGGLIAQQVRDAIDARLGEGAAVRLGLLCHDSWDAIPEQRDDEGVVLRPAVEAGERWGLRYDECFALEAAWLRRKLARIEALMGGDDDAG
jgi:hypothetical protein